MMIARAGCVARARTGERRRGVRRALIMFIVFIACLSWLGTSGAITPRLRPAVWRGQESFVSVMLSSSRIAVTWGMPTALIYQLCGFCP